MQARPGQTFELVSPDSRGKSCRQAVRFTIAEQPELVRVQRYRNSVLVSDLVVGLTEARALYVQGLRDGLRRW